MKVSKVVGTLALVSMFFVGCSSPVSSSKASAKAGKETAVVASKAKEEKKDTSSKAKEENKASKTKEEASAKEKSKVKDSEEKTTLLKDDAKTKLQTSDKKEEDDESSISMNGVEALRARNVTTDPIYMGYFRTWHDKHNDDEGWAKAEREQGITLAKPVQIMSEVPAEVDIVLVFPDYTPYPGSFWPTLKNEYVPSLNAQGTQVVRTIGFEYLGCDRNETKHLKGKPASEIAEFIVNEFVYKDDVNGLDIDIEAHNINYGEEAFNVLREIGKLIGPNGKDTSKLLIVDTNLPGRHGQLNSVIKEMVDSIDFVGLQIYGHKNLEYDVSNTRKNMGLPNNKILIGFAFYEENANNHWRDLYGCVADHELTGLETTNAAKMAKFRPAEGGDIAGIFGYAIDRDGVKEYNNTKFIHTTYPWSKELKRMMVEVRKN